MEDSPPHTYRLFKYRSIAEHSRKYTSHIVTDGRINYAAPTQFTDPFDCQFSINMDQTPLNAFGLSKRDEIKAFAAKWLWDETNKDVCVLSLSELNDNLLMWSHYSDSHTGICLELTFQTLEKLHEVRYSDVRPQFFFADVREQDRDDERYRNGIISTLTTKASHWAYEKECRGIDFGGPGEREMPDGMLSGIIFGCRTSDADKQTVRDWVASAGRNVTFSQAVQRDGAFAVDIERVN
jgi:hypothetical protein